MRCRDGAGVARGWDLVTGSRTQSTQLRGSFWGAHLEDEDAQRPKVGHEVVALTQHHLGTYQASSRVLGDFSVRLSFVKTKRAVNTVFSPTNAL